MLLELNIVRRSQFGVGFMIDYQNTEKLKRGDFRYTATNGMKIASSGSPDIGNNILFIRGVDKSEDRKILFCTHRIFRNILTAVDELNRGV